MSKNIVIISTSASALASGAKTGLWLEELASPYYAFKKAGFSVTIASCEGGEITLDQASLGDGFLTPAAADFLKDGELLTKCPLLSLSCPPRLGPDWSKSSTGVRQPLMSNNLWCQSCHCPLD